MEVLHSFSAPSSCQVDFEVADEALQSPRLSSDASGAAFPCLLGGALAGAHATRVATRRLPRRLLVARGVHRRAAAAAGGCGGRCGREGAEGGAGGVQALRQGGPCGAGGHDSLAGGDVSNRLESDGEELKQEHDEIDLERRR